MWGIQGNSARGYSIFPQIGSNNTYNKLEYIKDPREAINRAKVSNSIVQLGNDPNFATYVAQVGSAWYKSLVENQAAKEQWVKMFISTEKDTSISFQKYTILN